MNALTGLAKEPNLASPSSIMRPHSLTPRHLIGLLSLPISKMRAIIPATSTVCRDRTASCWASAWRLRVTGKGQDMSFCSYSTCKPQSLSKDWGGGSIARSISLPSSEMPRPCYSLAHNTPLAPNAYRTKDQGSPHQAVSPRCHDPSILYSSQALKPCWAISPPLPWLLFYPSFSCHLPYTPDFWHSLLQEDLSSSEHQPYSPPVFLPLALQWDLL